MWKSITIFISTGASSVLYVAVIPGDEEYTIVSTWPTSLLLTAGIRREGVEKTCKHFTPRIRPSSSVRHLVQATPSRRYG